MNCHVYHIVEEDEREIFILVDENDYWKVIRNDRDEPDDWDPLDGCYDSFILLSDVVTRVYTDIPVEEAERLVKFELMLMG